jgi:hypothetical protein
MSLARKLEEFEGKLMSTVSFLAILNELKLMMVLLEAVMLRVVELGDVTVAEPFSTWIPWGRAKTTDINNKLAQKPKARLLEYFKREFIDNTHGIVRPRSLPSPNKYTI